MLEPIWKLRRTTSRQITTFDRSTKEKFLRIEPGERAVVGETEGPGVVTRVWFTFPGWFWQHWEPTHPVDQSILRALVLRISWDGSDFPSVVSPLGDFFGVGHCEYRHYTSRYLGMSSGGFYCYFPMPFRKLRVEVENLHGSMAALLFCNLNYELCEELPADAGRFHCSFDQRESPGSEEVTILETTGSGHYVGCCVSIQGKFPNELSFLEAPEIVQVDSGQGDAPAIHGTGMEDYFNGGWYFRDQEFCAPLHGVPLKDPLRSMITMYRFHEHDAIAFRKSIHFSFVNPWPPERLRPFVWSATAYWYQDRPVKLKNDSVDPNSAKQLYRIRDADHQSLP